MKPSQLKISVPIVGTGIRTKFYYFVQNLDLHVHDLDTIKTITNEKIILNTVGNNTSNVFLCFIADSSSISGVNTHF